MMNSRLELYANGRWLDRRDARRISVIDPTTEQAIADIAEGTPADVDLAVAVANGVFDEWAGLGFAQRAKFLDAIADSLAQRRQELVDMIVSEVGTPVRVAETMQVDMAIQAFREIAGLDGEWERAECIGNSLVSRVPIGTAGLGIGNGASCVFEYSLRCGGDACERMLSVPITHCVRSP